MAGKKETQRFIFFKYVPPKKEKKPLKDEEYSNAADTDTQGVGLSDNESPDNPVLTGAECSDYVDFPECPTEPEPECPDYPECPTEPEPECPDYPECPETPVCPGEGEKNHDDEQPCEKEEPCEDDVPEGPCPKNAVMHVIQAGDTFWKLAKKYGTTIEAIAAANPEADPLNLQIGETLCIPLGIPGAKG